ncbi:transformer-2 protein homolog [Penaeus monodon]|uniref:transformer-2 protein homolog n=1 Tax=Penaeus monodon TaxID=6687 RepID=UPI0018A781AD|nr:transformer-2 protein homolog [Penaeus monodon]
MEYDLGGTRCFLLLEDVAMAVYAKSVRHTSIWETFSVQVLFREWVIKGYGGEDDGNGDVYGGDDDGGDVYGGDGNGGDVYGDGDGEWVIKGYGGEDDGNGDGGDVYGEDDNGLV